MNSSGLHWLFVLVLAIFTLPSMVEAQQGSQQKGKASHYLDGYNGLTASGERYDPQVATASHPTLDFGTLIRVTHARSGRSVVVQVNDRSPYYTGTLVFLSKTAAKEIGMWGEMGDVLVSVVGQAPASQVSRGNSSGPRLLPVAGVTARQQMDPQVQPLPSDPEDGQSMNRAVYRVQFRACSNWQVAEAERKKLADARIGALILESNHPEYPYRLVSTSVFFSQQEAARWIASVNAETANHYEDAFIVR